MKRRAAQNYLAVEKGVGAGAGVDVMRVGGGSVSCVAAGGASAVRRLASARGARAPRRWKCVWTGESPECHKRCVSVRLWASFTIKPVCMNIPVDPFGV